MTQTIKELRGIIANLGVVSEEDTYNDLVRLVVNLEKSVAPVVRDVRTPCERLECATFELSQRLTEVW